MSIVSTPAGPVLQVDGTLQRLPERAAPHETVEAVASYLFDEVRVAHRRARDLIREGRPGQAAFVLTRSVERQARIVGLHLDVDEVWSAMRALAADPVRRHALAAASTEVRAGRSWGRS